MGDSLPLFLFPSRHKDLHNQVFSMVKASGRWFGMRAELLCSIFISLVATVCVYISQDAGKITCFNIHFDKRLNVETVMQNV